MKKLSFVIGAIVGALFIVGMSCKSDKGGNQKSESTIGKIVDMVGETVNTSIDGNGKTIEKSFDLKDFTSVSLGVSADMELTQGESFSVQYIGEENFLEYLEVEVKNNDLNIKIKRGYWMKNQKPMKFKVTMPSVNSINLGGSGTITAMNSFKSKNIEINIGGSGDIFMKGEAESIDVNVGGSGTVKMYDMPTKKAEVNIGGSGDCYMTVSDKLEVNVAGSGDVHYKGNPSIEKNIVGSGEVTKEN